MTDAPPPSDWASEDLPPVQRSIPFAHAVLWQPVEALDDPPVAGAYPVFVTRRALEALNAHAPPTTAGGVFGFLVGDFCHCPRTGILYLAIDLLIGLPQPIYGDKAAAMAAHVWPALQNQLGKVKRHLLGWYHSHPPMGLTLAPGDAEAHFEYFSRPWQVALVLGLTERGPEAGFFRPIFGVEPTEVPLPFYELLDPRAQTADGRPRSFVHWKNYHARRPAEASHTPVRPPAPRAPPAPLVAPPDLPPPPPPPPPLAAPIRPAPLLAAPPHHPSVSWPRPAVAPRSARVPARRGVRVPMLVAVAGAAVIFFLGRTVFGPRATEVALAPASAARRASAPAAATPPTERPLPPAPSSLEQLGESLAVGLDGYQDRAAAFGGKRRDCRGLARALVDVEQRWITYSVQRKHVTAPLDAVQAATDSGFYAAMDSVESGYERSGCPRP